MNNLEKAIAYFEDAVHESDEIMADCSPDLQAELAEQKVHFVTALDALRDQRVRPGKALIKETCLFCGQLIPEN